MEDKSNITLKLDKSLLRAVKVVAAKRGTSISAYVAETLTEAMKHDDSYEDSKQRAIALMKESRSLGWKKPKSRDELYER
ncbi:MAG TPA: DUF6364 family protein [Candidatus Acidoferrum sp.]|nr:DUF6364 family protein [Candidatus Acidoferrum sp.]